MLHGFTKLVPALLVLTSLAWAGVQEESLLVPRRQLFVHQKHLEVFKARNKTCTDCHSFAKKADSPDPLGEPVAAGGLIPRPTLCHECHLSRAGKAPTPNQCTLCHREGVNLKPKDHLNSWTKRHGMMAHLDEDSCKQCHSERTCNNCHLQRDTNKPSVHKANFRYTHSIEARGNPQSCAVCHSGANFCTNCHLTGVQ